MWYKLDLLSLSARDKHISVRVPKEIKMKTPDILPHSLNKSTKFLLSLQENRTHNPSHTRLPKSLCVRFVNLAYPSRSHYKQITEANLVLAWHPFSSWK